MSCITQLLELKGDKEFLPIHNEVVIEGGGVYKGHEYLITFTEHGHRCGYVAIPSGVTVDTDDINCHGGVTFEDEHHHAKSLLPVPCNDTWIGFDAAHWGDMPCRDTSRKYFGHSDVALKKIKIMEEIHKDIHEMESKDPSFSHKTFEYMEEQCKSVIDQLLEQAA
jgi:hypothetical protein